MLRMVRLRRRYFTGESDKTVRPFRHIDGDARYRRIAGRGSSQWR
jgi:hypothetical protein